MELKWESNSRVKNLAALGKINQEDIIKRTTTDRFPAETATVRMANVRAQEPFITIHIRGEGKERTNHYNNYKWFACTTMRVNFGGGTWKEYGVSGELDGNLDFAKVDRLVKEVTSILKT